MNKGNRSVNEEYRCMTTTSIVRGNEEIVMRVLVLVRESSEAREYLCIYIFDTTLQIKNVIN